MHNTYSADVLDHMIKTHTLAEVLAFAARMAQNAAECPQDAPKTLPPCATTARPGAR